jgi:hypothetical protein
MTAPYQSKLIPHEDFIRQCREKRWSYPRIAAALLAEHGLKTGATTIFDFVKVRARKRRLVELPAKPSTPKSETNQPSNPAHGFFEPKSANQTHEIRKPKYKINL